MAGTGAIGFAASAGPIVTVSGGGFGADGPAATGSETLALTVTDGTGATVLTYDDHFTAVTRVGSLVLSRPG